MALKALGALTGAKPKNKRSSTGGEGQQSLRDALRARGGAQNAATVHAAQTDIEDNFEAREHSKMEWLNLQAFAPTSLQTMVDKIRAGEMPQIPQMPPNLAGIALPMALRRTGESEAEAEASPPPMGSDDSEVSDATGPSTEKRKQVQSGLRSALQSRGGVRVGQQQAQAPVAAEDVRDGQDGAGAAACPSESPTMSALASVAEDGDDEPANGVEAPEQDEASAGQESLSQDAERAETGAHDVDIGAAAASDEAAAAPAPVEEAADGPVADQDQESSQDDPAGEASDAAAAAAAIEETSAEASEETPAPAEGPEEAPGLAEAPSIAAAAAAASKEQPSRRSSRPQGARPAKPTAAPPVIVNSVTAYPMAAVQQSSQSGEDGAPVAQPILAPEAPAAVEAAKQQKKAQPGKLNELRQFWGQGKSTVGFAGPQIAGSRMSRGEAQATLQRIAAAGGDLDQVRMLRKMISELDDGEPPSELVP